MSQKTETKARVGFKVGVKGVNGQYYWKDSSLVIGIVTGIPMIGLIGIFFYGLYSGLGSSL